MFSTLYKQCYLIKLYVCLSYLTSPHPEIKSHVCHISRPMDMGYGPKTIKRSCLPWIFLVGLTLLIFYSLFKSTPESQFLISQITLLTPKEPRPPYNIKKAKSLFWGTTFGSNHLDGYCIKDTDSMSFCDFDCTYSIDQSLSSIESSDAIIIHGREE